MSDLFFQHWLTLKEQSWVAETCSPGQFSRFWLKVTELHSVFTTVINDIKFLGQGATVTKTFQKQDDDSVRILKKMTGKEIEYLLRLKRRYSNKSLSKKHCSFFTNLRSQFEKVSQYRSFSTMICDRRIPEKKLVRESNSAIINLNSRVISGIQILGAELANHQCIYTGWKTMSWIRIATGNHLPKDELSHLLSLTATRRGSRYEISNQTLEELKRLKLNLVPGSPEKRTLWSKLEVRLRVVRLESLNGDIMLDANHACITYSRCRALLVWCELWRRWKDGKRVPGRILNQVVGGYSVGIAGYVAFLPSSRFFHVSQYGVGFLDWFYLANMNPQTRNIVVTQFSSSR